MRVGIDYRPVTAAPSSGIARQVLALESAVCASGNEVSLFTACPLEHPHRAMATCSSTDTPAHALHRFRQRIRFERSFLPVALAAADVDIYIATANSGLPIACRLGKLRTAVLLHDAFQITLRNRHATVVKEWLYRGIDRAAITYTVRRADAIWVPSSFTAAEVARLFPAQAAKLRVLPNAVAPLPVPSASQAFCAGLPARYWLIVGSSEPRKNVPFFLRAWIEASRRRPANAGLVIVGSPTDVSPELRELAGLHWRSNVDDASLAYLYSHAQRVWQPSFAEGFCLPVVEALAHGTAVAVARGSSLDEVAPPQAPRFDPHDHEALVRLMIELDDAAPELDADQCSQFARRYSVDAHAQRVRELLVELAS